MSANTWYHFAYVIENLSNGTSKATLYKDGVYVNSVTYAGLVGLPDYPIYIGRAIGISGINDDNDYQWKGMIQDIRIYDECLSAEEIKEISRGMVLHYKMCQPERSENLYVYNSISTGGFGLLDVPYPTFSHNSVTRTTTITNNGGGALRISNLGLNGYSGHLTISFYAWASKACSFLLDCCDYDCTPSINLTTVKKKFVVNTNHVTDRFNTSNNYNGFIDWNFSNTSGAIIYIQDLKVEKGENPNPQWSPAPSDNPNWGTIEYDGSGYKNHGTVSGNVTLSTDSPRYTGSYTFNGNDTSILIGDLSKLTPDGNFTMSCWIKKSEFSSKGYDTIFGGPSGFELESKNDAANERKFCAHNWGGGKWDYEFNKWYHLVMVRTSSDTKFYFSPESGFNNTPVITGDPGSIPSGNYYVGSWRSATEQNYKGLVSDFRIYATALDATDVAELYKLGR